MDTKEALVNLRKAKGLTQEDMAGKLFVTRQAVSRWETGETTPNIDTLKLISQEFGVSINEALGQPHDVECQSCAMPLREADDLGTNADGGVNIEYCTHCYQGGGFTHNRTIDEMIHANLQFLDEFNAENGTHFSEAEAKTILKEHLATLKRWQAIA